MCVGAGRCDALVRSAMASDGADGAVTATSRRQFPVSPTLRQPAKERGPRAERTVAKILAATKEIFLTRGYIGTTIDEITKAAGVSRASFYTYFPSKRDVLLALGAESAHAAEAMVDFVSEIPLQWTTADIEVFVHKSFTVLDDHASFGFAWTQAAHEDEEIRVAGMRRHLQVCRRMGQALGVLRGVPFADNAAQGILVFSMLERAWSFCKLYEARLPASTMEQAIAATIEASLTTSS